MAAYMEQWPARRDLAPSVFKILEEISKRVHNHPEEDEEHVIATWCNAGEHRSVDIGEAILALAVALGMAVQGEDKVRYDSSHERMGVNMEAPTLLCRGTRLQNDKT